MVLAAAYSYCALFGSNSLQFGADWKLLLWMELRNILDGKGLTDRIGGLNGGCKRCTDCRGPGLLAALEIKLTKIQKTVDGNEAAYRETRGSKFKLGHRRNSGNASSLNKFTLRG